MHGPKPLPLSITNMTELEISLNQFAQQFSLGDKHVKKNKAPGLWGCLYTYTLDLGGLGAMSYTQVFLIWREKA